MGGVSGSDVRVLYVLGIYHSGTTVLSNLVGQLDGFFAAGELRHLWPKLALGGYRCGCGEPLEECPAWTFATAILKAVAADRRRAVVRTGRAVVPAPVAAAGDGFLPGVAAL